MTEEAADKGTQSAPVDPGVDLGVVFNKEKFLNRAGVVVLRNTEEYAVLKVHGSHLCGYCWLPVDDVPSGQIILTYMNNDMDVHGGITYLEQFGDFVIYGFDCAHINDEKNPDCPDPDKVLEWCKEMKKEIRKAIHQWVVHTEIELNRVKEIRKAIHQWVVHTEIELNRVKIREIV